MKELDQSRRLSEQDFGGFLEVATLTEDLVLTVNAGYGPEQHNDEAKYQLGSKPEKSLDSVASDGWLDPLSDQSEDFVRWLGVAVSPL